MRLFALKGQMIDLWYWFVILALICSFCHFIHQLSNNWLTGFLLVLESAMSAKQICSKYTQIYLIGWNLIGLSKFCNWEERWRTTSNTNIIARGNEEWHVEIVAAPGHLVPSRIWPGSRIWVINPTFVYRILLTYLLWYVIIDSHPNPTVCLTL